MYTVCMYIYIYAYVYIYIWMDYVGSPNLSPTLGSNPKFLETPGTWLATFASSAGGCNHGWGRANPQGPGYSAALYDAHIFQVSV